MNLKSFYSLFNLQPAEVGIFEALLQAGPQKASSLARQIKTNRTTVYNFLERLMKEGLIYETIKSGVKIFAVQPYDKMNLLIREKEERVSEARASLGILKSVYATQKYFQPRIQIFEGQAELRQMMNDMLLYPNITVLAYWPILKVVENLGSDFLNEFHRKRMSNNISLRTIWPKMQIPSSRFGFLKIGKVQKREVRIAPADTNFSLGYAIYKDTVRFISSSRESFGFLIESKELVEMMRGQFELVWQISKPY